MHSFLPLIIKSSLLTCWLFLSLLSHAQQEEILRSAVIDGDTKKPLSYATVVNLRSGNGTVTDHNGNFRLNRVRTDDVIHISFVGYENRKLEASEIENQSAVVLTPRSELIGEVIISGDDDYLYELIRKARKTGTGKKRVAKTYFSLQTNASDKQVELLECYYNGEFSGYDVDQLNLKNGRIALAPFGKNYFISTEPSKVMCMYSAFDGHDYFPNNPLELRRRKLRKSYYLDLASKYKNENGEVVYVISFEPKNEPRSFFSGKVWVDSLRNDVIKLELKSADVAHYPFVPIWPSDSLLAVGMELTKTYQRIEGQLYLNSVDFNYQLRYQHRDGSIDNISTHAVLYAYDYQEEFALPFFHFTDPQMSDYRKINAIPYNAYFWENFDEFKLNDLQDKNREFANDPSTIGNNEMFVRTGFGKEGILQQPYVHWSGKRVVFREQEFDKATSYELGKLAPSERYNLKGRIFMDINHINDSLHVLTSAVLDPYDTYFRFPMDDTARVFINLYFDLIEVERRILEEELEGCTTSEEMIEVYQQRMAKVDGMTRRFLSDAERGLNKRGMLKWNERVFRHLGIDNLAIFGVYIE